MAEEEVVDDVKDEVKDEEVKDEVKDEEVKDESEDHWSNEFKDDKHKKIASRYNTQEDMAKGMLDLRGKLSKKGGPLGEDADDVEVADYRKAHNVPESAGDYDFPPLEGEADTEANKQNTTEWKDLFHKHNASKELVKEVLEKYGADVVAGTEQQGLLDKQFAEATDTELREDWGENYETNKAFANHAVRAQFGDSYEDVSRIQTMDGRFVMDHPAFVKAFSSIGREMSEGSLAADLTETEVESVQEKADQYREKAKAAQAHGKTAEANRWAAKELAELEKLDKSESKN